MFGIGMPEMLLILAVALIVIGPKKLPDLAKSLGRALGEFKRATSDLKDSMQIDSDLGDVKKAFKDINADVKDVVGSVPDTPTSQEELPRSSLKKTDDDKEAEDKKNDSALKSMADAFEDVDIDSLNGQDRSDDNSAVTEDEEKPGKMAGDKSNSTSADDDVPK